MTAGTEFPTQDQFIAWGETIRNPEIRMLYKFWATRFCGWAERQDADMTEPVLSRWLVRLTQEGYSELSLLQACAAVRSLCSYLACGDRRDDNG